MCCDMSVSLEALLLKSVSTDGLCQLASRSEKVFLCLLLVDHLSVIF